MIQHCRHYCEDAEVWFWKNFITNLCFLKSSSSQVLRIRSVLYEIYFRLFNMYVLCVYKRCVLNYFLCIIEMPVCFKHFHLLCNYVGDWKIIGKLFLIILLKNWLRWFLVQIVLNCSENFTLDYLSQIHKCFNFQGGFLDKSGLAYAHFSPSIHLSWSRESHKLLHLSISINSESLWYKFSIYKNFLRERVTKFMLNFSNIFNCNIII